MSRKPSGKRPIGLFDDDILTNLTTEPSVSANTTFLDDVHPFARRVILAAQEHYVQETKYKNFKKKLIEDEIAEREDADTTVIAVKNDGVENRSMLHNGVPSIELVKLQIVNTSIYHKLISHLQHFYNNHDSQSIVSLLFFPFATPDMERSMCLWSSTLKAKRGETLSATNNSLLAKRITHGLQSLAQTYNHVFQKLPDIIIHFENISKHDNISSGNIQIIAPYTLFFTIPNITLSDSEILVKDVRVELQGYTVFAFEGHNNHLRSAHDHYVRITVDNPLITAMHILQYMNLTS